MDIPLMNLLLVLSAMIVAIVIFQFEGGAQSPSQERIAARAEADTYQFEQFATAAWTAARAGGVDGLVDRSSLQLPAGFADGGKMQAKVIGQYLYVWSTAWSASSLDQAGLDRLFPGADQSVSVGITNGFTIRFRDGSLSPKNPTLPASLVMVRIRI